MASNKKNGFFVPYTVRATPDKGLGVFVEASVPKDTILWRHVRGLYAVYDDLSLTAYLSYLSRGEIVYELTHMYGLPEFPGYIIRILDDGVLINHSYRPNTAMKNISGENEDLFNGSPKDSQEVEDTLLDDRFALVAIQDLEIGDELTMDYTTSIEDPLFYDDLCKQYDVSEPFLDM